MPHDNARQVNHWSASQRIGLTVMACIGTTVLATPLLPYLDLSNIVMLFLLTVVVIAVKLGRNAAVVGSVLSVLLFDIFFVPPRFSIVVSDVQYLVTFAVMLMTALITTHLTAALSERAQEASQREQRTQALFRLAEQLAGAQSTGQVAEIADAFVRTQLPAQSVLLMPDAALASVHPAHAGATVQIERHLAQMAFDKGRLVRNAEAQSMGMACLYLPLKSSLQVLGVLAIAFDEQSGEPREASQSLLEGLTALLAVAVERVHYVESAHETQVKMRIESLRSSILTALSHDLRPPLSAMTGLTDSLLRGQPFLPGPALQTAQALHDQVEHMNRLVNNLIDMAKLNVGELALRRAWQSLEDVIAVSLRGLGDALEGHPVQVTVDKEMPPVDFDAVLIDRVLCNLLENAAQHAPPKTPIDVKVTKAGTVAEVLVLDHGPGFVRQRRDDLLEMFVRAGAGPATPGADLGLAICKVIVEAHGGTIHAERRPEGGGLVRFSLPIGHPPDVEGPRA